MGDSICWAAYETDTQFTLFDLSGPKKQCLIFKLYRKRGRVSRGELEEMADAVWNKCVLCERCYCPVGIKIPDMIAFGRDICRSQGVYKTHYAFDD